jgi:hypothetical protein
MAFLETVRGRAGMLLLCFGLIGGSACMSVPRPVSDADQAWQAEQRQLHETDLRNALEAGAQRREAAAMARLGRLHWLGGWGVERDPARAKALLEDDAAQGDGLAQLSLGSMLIHAIQATPADVERGLALLRQSTDSACSYYVPAPEHRRAYPYRLLVDYFSQAGAASEAQLWSLRYVRYCHPSSDYLATFNFDTTPVGKLAWSLFGQAQAGNAASLPAPQRAAAEQLAATYRKRVSDAESRYPPPHRTGNQ